MNRAEILNSLKDILKKVYPSSSDLYDKATEDSTLSIDLALNSIGILCMVISIEEIFKVDFSGTSFSDFKTVGNVIDFIERSLS